MRSICYLSLHRWRMPVGPCSSNLTASLDLETDLQNVLAFLHVYAVFHRLHLPGTAAAAYVALSRVRKDSDYLLGGVLTCKHFVPAW